MGVGDSRMRIIAGDWRGRALVAPEGLATRPTSDRVREAVFSTLDSRFHAICDASVLDLYAGSGALALEALSRGAACATLVEHARPALEALHRNTATLGAVNVRVHPGDAARFVAPAGTDAFTLLFIDPPYKIAPEDVSDILSRLRDAEQVASGAVVVYEHHSGTLPVWPVGFTLVTSRRYGTTSVSYAIFTEEPRQ